MATIKPELSICPFCGSSFQWLGCHLPKCKHRDGRDYEYLLSAKTLAKKCKSKKKPCPVCNKQFYRLDTHLRFSRSCQIDTSPPTKDPITEDPIAQEPPQQLISASPDSPQIPATPLPPTMAELPTLKLPTSDEEWLEAD